MPKVLKDQPETLQPYVFHGLDVDWRTNSKEAVSQCPWCDKEGKFSLNVKTGQWRCLVCGEGSTKGGGNIASFLKMLWEKGFENVSDEAVNSLAADRKLLSPESILYWQLGVNPVENSWVIPGFNVDGKLSGLYKYTWNGQRMMCMPTPGRGHHLFGMNLYDPKKETLYLCEGIWDSIALWEIMSKSKRNELDEIVPTSNIKASLLEDANILGAPSSSVFMESWEKVCQDKSVVLMAHNDHPRVNPKTGDVIPSASYAGIQRIAQTLSSSRTPPREISVLFWGEHGPNLELPSGYDVRDALSGGISLSDRCRHLARVFGSVRPIPDDWIGEVKERKASGAMESMDCPDFKTLVNSWRKALKWTDGLDCALSVMLASITSTKSVGDQLWIKIIGPASCGKSTLCEAISINEEYVLAKSTIRGFHSGFKSNDGTDNSLISQVAGKTLVTKDGDTLLQSPNLGQILSEARDVYDCVSRTHYRNAASQDYVGKRMTWLLAGTNSLRSIDSSELGERFLDCVIMDGIDDEFEDEVLLRKAYQVDRNMAQNTDDNPESNYEPELALAMQLTGGYVGYLRRNASDLLSAVGTPPSALQRCTRLGKFVAFMRARPSSLQEETQEREFAARLVSQHVRLAKCLAVVLNKRTVDEEVMRRVTKVSMDTSRGQTMDIINRLAQAPMGLEPGPVAQYLAKPDDQIRKLLRFLQQIKAVEPYKAQPKNGSRSTRTIWKLTERMLKLYNEVMSGAK